MRRSGRFLWIVMGLPAVLACSSLGQTMDFTAVRAEVDFSKQVRDWDGFGVNYVEVAQSVDYTQDPQEYGGFSLLTEEERQQIVDMVFGRRRPQARPGQDVPRPLPPGPARRRVRSRDHYAMDAVLCARGPQADPQPGRRPDDYYDALRPAGLGDEAEVHARPRPRPGPQVRPGPIHDRLGSLPP